MISWVLRKLGLTAAPEAVVAEDADISDDYQFVFAPQTKKPVASQFSQLMSRFTSQSQDVTLTEMKPFLRRPVMNESNKEFFARLTKIIGNPPVNQASPTLSEVAPLPPKKKKTFNPLRPADVSDGNRNAFSDVLSQIKAIKKPLDVEEEAKVAEPITPSIKFSDAYISQRLAITQMLCELKGDHFSQAAPLEQKVVHAPIIVGEFAPDAPPFTSEEPLLTDVSNTVCTRVSMNR